MDMNEGCSRCGEIEKRWRSSCRHTHGFLEYRQEKGVLNKSIWILGKNMKLDWQFTIMQSERMRRTLEVWWGFWLFRAAGGSGTGVMNAGLQPDERMMSQTVYRNTDWQNRQTTQHREGDIGGNKGREKVLHLIVLCVYVVTLHQGSTPYKVYVHFINVVCVMSANAGATDVLITQ